MLQANPEYDHILDIISGCEQRMQNIENQEPSTLTESVISATNLRNLGTQIDMSKLWETSRFSGSSIPLGQSLKIAFRDIMDQVTQDEQWHEDTANAFSQIFGDKLHNNLQNLLLSYQSLNNENISIDESEVFEEHLKKLFKEQERKTLLLLDLITQIIQRYGRELVDCTIVKLLQEALLLQEYMFLETKVS